MGRWGDGEVGRWGISENLLTIDLKDDTLIAMVWCFNLDCQNPHNPDGTNFCRSCGARLESSKKLRNRYRLIRPLGGGGFGKTFLAEDEDKLNERCVVKQLAPQAQGIWAIEKATELFRQEARRLQQLGEHPQIPTLYAHFEEDRCLYLVQQFIQGQNLLEELALQGVFSERKIKELLSDLLPILQFVHEHQVIHRDIKPENVIRRHDDGKLVLIDFGVAKQLTVPALARSGTTIGSFGYAPIEQMKGGEAYPASDLYILGATCFYLLTGIDPSELWTEQGYGWVADWQKHLNRPVSQKLKWILGKLLQKDHLQRYQSADEVFNDLNAIGQPQRSQQLQRQATSVGLPLAKGGVIPVRVLSRLPVGISNLNLTTANQPRLKRHPFSPFNFLLLPRQTRWLIVSVFLLLGLGGYGYWHQEHLAANTTWGFTVANSLIGHSESVLSVAISPDGETVASGSGDHTIKIWQLRTGNLIRTLYGHSSWVSAIAISPDGQTLVSGSGDNTIKIWQLRTGQLLRTLVGHSKWVNSIAISPDGQTLASGSGDNTIKIWQLRTGRLLHTLTKHSYGVNSIAISPDNETMVSGNGTIWPFGDDYTIKIWQLNTGLPKRTITGHSSYVNSVAISPDGQTLASGSGDNTIKIWQLQTGQLLHNLTGHSAAVLSVAISSDGQTLVSGSGDNTIKIWQLRTGQLLRTLAGPTSWVSSVAISPDGQTLVSGSGDDTIKVWRIPK